MSIDFSLRISNIWVADYYCAGMDDYPRTVYYAFAAKRGEGAALYFLCARRRHTRKGASPWSLDTFQWTRMSPETEHLRNNSPLYLEYVGPRGIRYRFMEMRLESLYALVASTNAHSKRNVLDRLNHMHDGPVVERMVVHVPLQVIDISTYYEENKFLNVTSLMLISKLMDFYAWMKLVVEAGNSSSETEQRRAHGDGPVVGHST